MNNNLRPQIKVDHDTTAKGLSIKALCALRSAGLHRSAAYLDDRLCTVTDSEEMKEIISEYVSISVS